MLLPGESRWHGQAQVHGYVRGLLGPLVSVFEAERERARESDIYCWLVPFEA